MWLFTKYGFYSPVCARQGDGSHGNPPDVDRIMVRARSRAHLEALQARFAAELGDLEIHASKHSDYACRLFVDKPTWTKVVAALVAETDYDNFKSKVAAHQGRTAYERALHEVWGVMHRLQREKE